MPDEPEAAGTETVSVYTRVRAGLEGEDEIKVMDDPTKIRARNLEFNLDHCFSQKASQEDVYGVVGEKLVERVVEGFNAAILAYGQTGSGKTFTMLGPEEAKLKAGSGALAPDLGVVPRACHQLFRTLPSGFVVVASYIEVYNDAVNDLLGAEKTKYLALRETAGHVEPDGLTKVPVSDVKDVMGCVSKGDQRRVVAAMAMNPRSSRGHGIIILEVLNGEGKTHGRLTLVDLAGMESSKKSAAVEEGPSNVAARREEAKRINISLLALASVISALASKGAMRIPFRDSKLTRLLQSSLGGNCKAAFVVTLRTEKKNVEEAINTLRFAQRAKAVEATVVKNDAIRKPTGAGAKKLAAELDVAKGALADFEEKLASSESYKEALMAEVQTLLGEMASLQKDSEDAKKKAAMKHAHASDKANYPGYVAALERRVNMLEEENRVLRQRDIMNRLLVLDAGEAPPPPPAAKAGAGAEPAAAAAAPAPAMPKLDLQLSRKNLVAFQPFAVEKAAQPMGAAEIDLRRATSREVLVGKEKQQSAWAGLRWAGVFVRRQGKVQGAKVAPAPEAKPGKPAAKKARLSKAASTVSATHVAAVRIQAIWRGKQMRDELAYWDSMGY